MIQTVKPWQQCIVVFIVGQIRTRLVTLHRRRKSCVREVDGGKTAVYWFKLPGSVWPSGVGSIVKKNLKLFVSADPLLRTVLKFFAAAQNLHT